MFEESIVGALTCHFLLQAQVPKVLLGLSVQMHTHLKMAVELFCEPICSILCTTREDTHPSSRISLCYELSIRIEGCTTINKECNDEFVGSPACPLFFFSLVEEEAILSPFWMQSDPRWIVWLRQNTRMCVLQGDNMTLGPPRRRFCMFKEDLENPHMRARYLRNTHMRAGSGFASAACRLDSKLGTLVCMHY